VRSLAYRLDIDQQGRFKSMVQLEYHLDACYKKSVSEIDPVNPIFG
jgi:hypothetical protein